MDFQGSYILKNLYVKMKESGPLGGHVLGMSPSRSTNGIAFYMTSNTIINMTFIVCDNKHVLKLI